MLVKATVSFAGAFSMYAGEVREIDDSAELLDLLSCGYVEEVEPKGGGKHGGKPDKP